MQAVDGKLPRGNIRGEGRPGFSDLAGLLLNWILQGRRQRSPRLRSSEKEEPEKILVKKSLCQHPGSELREGRGL